MKSTIVIYPGSFDPFHIGHLNIIEKAERAFGKGSVMIAMGINLDKVDPKGLWTEEQKLLFIEKKKAYSFELQQKIGRDVIVYNKFLHELVNEYETMGFNVVVLRGLRNGTDLNYEVNQLRFVNDFKKDVNVVYITCDQEFEHISSSSINKIEKFGGSEMIKQYLV